MSVPRFRIVAPTGTADCAHPHLGRVRAKPWDYRVTAAIPHINTPGVLEASLATILAQDEPAYVVIIDTGSRPEDCDRLEALRADNVEIHYLRAHAWSHPSAPVAAAMDLAFAVCRTTYLYATHADCFLRSRDFLSRMVARCGPSNPVVGYRMSDRSHLTDQWRWMVSHTATTLHMPTMRAIGASWALDRYGPLSGDPGPPGGWPDTETCFNWCLKNAGITPDFLGDECNYCRQVDDDIDHVRSFPSSTLYVTGTAEYQASRNGWMEAAVAEADARVRSWRGR